MISKELLSLVLDEEFTRPSEIKKVGNNLMWYEMTIQNTPRYKRDVNLDTLGRLCKEWIYKNTAYEVTAYKLQDTNEYRCVVGLNLLSKYKDVVGFYADTELEAIIKATERIMENKD